MDFRSNVKTNKEIPVKLGKLIRAERLKQDLSQEELAEKADVHRTYIGMIERAEKNITVANLHKIAKALRVPLWKLVRSVE